MEPQKVYLGLSQFLQLLAEESAFCHVGITGTGNDFS